MSSVCHIITLNCVAISSLLYVSPFGHSKQTNEPVFYQPRNFTCSVRPLDVVNATDYQLDRPNNVGSTGAKVGSFPFDYDVLIVLNVK